MWLPSIQINIIFHVIFDLLYILGSRNIYHGIILNRLALQFDMAELWPILQCSEERTLYTCILYNFPILTKKKPKKTMSVYLCFMTQVGYHQMSHTLTLVILFHYLSKVKLTNKATVPHYSIKSLRCWYNHQQLFFLLSVSEKDLKKCCNF